jgi:ParB/Sulfiredoxin domain
MKTTIKNFRVADIRVLGKHRPLVKKKVRMLADSIKAIGLNTPPTVRPSKKGPILVTGQHRLEAAKSLGWKEIECFVMRGDKIERQLWRIAENLHRAGLTKLQRAEYFKEWDELIKKRGKGGQSNWASRERRFVVQRKLPVFHLRRKLPPKREDFLIIKRRCSRSQKSLAQRGRPNGCMSLQTASRLRAVVLFHRARRSNLRR